MRCDQQAFCHKMPVLLHKGVTILHNNAMSHTASWTCDWLQCYSTKVMDHAVYSAILIPGAFHLFGPCKEHLVDK